MLADAISIAAKGRAIATAAAVAAAHVSRRRASNDQWDATRESVTRNREK
jgi:hypothetical protein